MSSKSRQPKKLTERAKKFCRLVVRGDISHYEAYKLAYPDAKGNRHTVTDYASELYKSKAAQDYIASLTKAADDQIKLSRIKKLQLIEEQIEIEQGNRNTAALVALLKLHNEMTGDNAPIKTHTTIDILSAIANRHPELLEE